MDISKACGDGLLDELEGLLAADCVAGRRYRKPTFAKPAPIDLRLEIAPQCEVVIDELVG